ncbi:MAG: FAD-dependent oxidoreductase [Oscillospiraceae bacterium]|nr:FAD-dependent oxidoreductase [Oscillospiraceae bacterium]
MYRYEKNISVEAQIYDVIVVGGGSAGICAAIASARQGAKTLLVEDTGWLGGIGTTAAMVEFGPIVRGGLRVVGGIPYELMQRMRTFGGAELRDDTEDLLFAPETFAHVAMLMCEEAGVELLLHTRMIDTIREGDAITGILLQDKEGMRIVTAKLYVDCTGDGDLFYNTGLPYVIGRDSDGHVQPMTLVFFVNDVNYAKFLEEVNKTYGYPVGKVETDTALDNFFKTLVSKAKADGRFHIPIVRPGSTGPVPRYGRPYDLHCCEVFINGTNILGLNGVNAKDLTLAECTTRKQIYEMYEFLRDYVPGFEDCYISHVPNCIGIRETRRLQGAYVLTDADLHSGRKFEDTIAVGFNMIDIHQVSGHDFDLTHFADGHYYSVPYRSLISNELTNLIVAGRCMSVTHEALGAVRVMVNTMPIGEAAGTAAAIAVKHNCNVADVPMTELQDTLRRGNAILGFD